MRFTVGIVAVTAGVGLLAGCSSSSSGGTPPTTPTTPATAGSNPVSTPSTDATSPDSTPTTQAADAAPPLPNGYVPLTASHLRIGVPKSWIAVPSGTSSADVQKLANKYPKAASRLTSDNGTQAEATKMFAVDPHSATNQVLVLIFSTPGVSTDGQGLQQLYNSSIKSSLQTNNIKVVGTHLTQLGGQDDLQINANYVKKGITVHEVLDLVGGDGEIYDLTFTGDASARTAIENTLAVV